MNKKIKYMFLLITFMLLLVGCNQNDNDKKEIKKERDYNAYATLKINMPLSFDDLDNYFEISLDEKLIDNNIGEVTGDGTPIDDNGPYATDIEIDFDYGKIDQLKKIISKYRFPKGSYLEINGKKQEELGDLLGVKIVFNNLSYDDANNIYNSLKETIKDKYIYTTFINTNNKYLAYFYSDDINILKSELTNYIVSKKIDDKLIMSDMLEYIKETS